MIMKKVLFISLVALAVSVPRAFSQCNGIPPQQIHPDKVALPSTAVCPNFTNDISTVSNTGYDLYRDQNAQVLYRVMVWDGTMASLSWDANGSQLGSIEFKTLPGIPGATLLDPDVVAQSYGGFVYAMVVGVVSAGTNKNRIFWQSFQWNTTLNLFQTNGPWGFLGSTSATSESANPNIDANECGAVVITWQTTNIETINISSGSPVPTNGPVTYKRADVYAVFGSINGTGCSGAPILTGTGGNAWDLMSDISTSPNHIFEMNTTPDVCISDRVQSQCGSYIVTFTWQRSWFDPGSFAFNSKVIALQYQYDFSGGCSQLSGTYYRELNFEDKGGRPRIASRPTFSVPNSWYRDFQIVLAYSGTSCGVTGSCPATCTISHKSAVLNWGVNNGVDLTTDPYFPATNYPPAVDLTTFPATCDLSPYQNTNAVVSYLNRGYGINHSYYAVAWEHSGNPLLSNCPTGIQGTVGTDIVVRVFENGLPAANSPNFSIVNEHACNLDQAGNQLIPSIASRYAWGTGGQSGFLHWEAGQRKYIAYRTTPGGVFPGNGNLTGFRSINPNEKIESLPTDAAESRFIASPNPFTNEITFGYKLIDGETSGVIEIYDLNGNLIDKTTVVNSSQEKAITLNLSPGIYVAKLKTNSRELVTRITKSE